MNDTMDISKIVQVIGCAYTYQGSLGIRKKLTAPLKEKGIHHSSQERDFSYFYKGNKDTVVGHNGALHLSDYEVDHWPEAELALILGKEHQIVGVTLANDFTAIGIETQGRTEGFDGTYVGKVWEGSCSVGPNIVHLDEIDIDNVDIGLRIVRDGSVMYEHSYNTKRRKRNFKELVDMIVQYHADFREKESREMVPVPPSKRIKLEDGFLVEGTVILAGTGLIVPQRCYSKKRDVITVYSSPSLGELENKVV